MHNIVCTAQIMHGVQHSRHSPHHSTQSIHCAQHSIHSTQLSTHLEPRRRELDRERRLLVRLDRSLSLSLSLSLLSREDLLCGLSSPLLSRALGEGSSASWATGSMGEVTGSGLGAWGERRGAKGAVMAVPVNSGGSSLPRSSSATSSRELAARAELGWPFAPPSGPGSANSSPLMASSCSKGWSASAKFSMATMHHNARQKDKEDHAVRQSTLESCVNVCLCLHATCAAT